MDRQPRPPSQTAPIARVARMAVLVAAALLGGCAHPGALRCDAGARPMIVERLYFGTERPGGVVSGSDWQAFVGDTIAARFPAGFTTWEATGGWRGADGRAVREASHVLEVMHPVDASGMDAAIDTTIAAYKARFYQEAVLRVRAPACAGP
jgi:hypothetical protein